MTEVTSGIGNSAASRDIAYHLHPYTNCKKSMRPKGRWSSVHG